METRYDVQNFIVIECRRDVSLLSCITNNWERERERESGYNLGAKKKFMPMVYSLSVIGNLILVNVYMYMYIAEEKKVGGWLVVGSLPRRLGVTILVSYLVTNALGV